MIISCGPPLLKLKALYLEMNLLSWCILLLFNAEVITNYILKQMQNNMCNNNNNNNANLPVSCVGGS